MSLTIPVLQNLALSMSTEPDGHSSYPTAALQKGFLLRFHEQTLAEEAVGFGVPVLKFGLQALFPGSVEIRVEPAGSVRRIRAAYTLDLVERISRNENTILKNPSLYGAKDRLAGLLRRAPALRSSLTALSSIVRRIFGWKTTYRPAGFSANVALLYTLDPDTGSLQIEVEPDCLRRLTATELILMDEQGAHAFDRYEEPGGVRLTGKEIGCWDEVRAPQASFTGSGLGVRFTVSQAAGARLSRGRELVGSRLAWAGFGHVLPLPAGQCQYSLRLETLP